jgi:hypothetical protein
MAMEVRNPQLLERLKQGVSYTVVMNYGVCQYRIYLQLQAPKSLVFPEQLRGLILHKYLEKVMKGEPLPRLSEAVRAVLQLEDRDDVVQNRTAFLSADERIEFIHNIKQELPNFVRACKEKKTDLERTGVSVISAEQGYDIVLSQSHPPATVRISCHPDLILKDEGGLVVVDLKTGKTARNALYSDQLVLYASILERVLETPCRRMEVWQWDGSSLSTFSRDLTDWEKDAVLYRHAHIGSVIQSKIAKLEDGATPSKLFYPNTRSKFCTERTCSYHHICPFFAEKQRRLKEANGDGTEE